MLFVVLLEMFLYLRKLDFRRTSRKLGLMSGSAIERISIVRLIFTAGKDRLPRFLMILLE